MHNTLMSYSAFAPLWVQRRAHRYRRSAIAESFRIRLFLAWVDWHHYHDLSHPTTHLHRLNFSHPLQEIDKSTDLPTFLSIYIYRHLLSQTSNKSPKALQIIFQYYIYSTRSMEEGLCEKSKRQEWSVRYVNLQCWRVSTR